MVHLTGNLGAVSGILGSVSIACWVVVFSPQILENFRRGSAEGLSVVFIAIWLIGDVFNILGAVLQGVLPTMIILAVYYTLADLVLLGQCFYYEGFTLKDKVRQPQQKPRQRHEEEATETMALLQDEPSSSNGRYDAPLTPADAERRESLSSTLELILSVDATHLSPATPLVDDRKPTEAPPPPPQTKFQGVLFNSLVVVLVCAAGVFGWWLGDAGSSPEDEAPSEPLEFNALGQVFGYICALLYLGSRIPQLLLNYRRKSTEGVSMLFFLFACIGNITYTLSIMAYDPPCVDGSRHCKPGEAGALYGRYILINFSWLLGAFGSLLLDLGVFVQYFMYLVDEDDTSSEEEEEEESAEEQGVVVRRGGRRDRVVYEDI